MNDEAEAEKLLSSYVAAYWSISEFPVDSQERKTALSAYNQYIKDIRTAPVEVRRCIVELLPKALLWNKAQKSPHIIFYIWHEALQESFTELPELTAQTQITYALYEKLKYRPGRSAIQHFQGAPPAWVKLVLGDFHRTSPEVLVNLLEQLPLQIAELNDLGAYAEARILEDSRARLARAEESLQIDSLPDDPEAAASTLLLALTTYAEALSPGEAFCFEKDMPNVQQLLIQPPEICRALRLNLLDLFLNNRPNESSGLYHILTWLYDALPEPALDETELIVQFLERYWTLPVSSPLYRQMNRANTVSEIAPNVIIIAAIRRAYAEPNPYFPTEASEALELEKAVSGAPELNLGEAWADKALADLETLPPKTRKLWRELFERPTSKGASRPTGSWNKKMSKVLAKLDTKILLTWLPKWFLLVGRPRTFTVRGHDGIGFDPYNEFVLRSLIWSLALLPPSSQSARALAHLAQVSLKKIPGVGPHSQKTAAAAIYALGQLGDTHALVQLSRLRARIIFKPALKVIDRTLDKIAKKAGLSREDLEELSVPTFGLNDQGVRLEALGDATAELCIIGKNVTLTWRNAAGKTLKNPPVSVKRDFAEELRELKAAQKDAAQALSTVATRLDNLFLAQKSWTLQSWRERYLEHPLVGTLARRLIWTVDDQSVGMTETGLEDTDGTFYTFDDDATVILWHPLGREQEVMAWREWLAARQITQPFKQAHREVYRLTGAEEMTRSYSNRFAAHILKQHQFSALCALRGWRNTLRLNVDSEAPPATLELPHWGLRAEFWIESAYDEQSAAVDSVTFPYLSTDQVRFYPIDAGQNSAHMAGGPYHPLYYSETPVEPVPFSEVQPLVFSEVMRDVDLFVCVTSVANDPLWFDRTDEHADYWQTASFGSLSATAETRKELLAALLPRLSLKDSCRLEGRFLVVRGSLRTYRIHLGSTNILMEPGSEYLCIVPSRNPGWTGDDVFLPFEGDSALSIILSKAFMLADDTAITDPLIWQQIAP